MSAITDRKAFDHREITCGIGTLKNKSSSKTILEQNLTWESSRKRHEEGSPRHVQTDRHSQSDSLKLGGILPNPHQV